MSLIVLRAEIAKLSASDISRLCGSASGKRGSKCDCTIDSTLMA